MLGSDCFGCRCGSSTVLKRYPRGCPIDSTAVIAREWAESAANSETTDGQGKLAGR